MKLRKKFRKKPWGGEEWIVFGKALPYAVKKLFLKKGARFSLQYHEKKVETWLVEEGKLLVQLGKKEFRAKKGDVIHVPPKTLHRITALEDSRLLEVSTPELWDVVRIGDDYGRKGWKESWEKKPWK
jgi:quercetin dioxygenase-like cupin family protein